MTELARLMLESYDLNGGRAGGPSKNLRLVLQKLAFGASFFAHNIYDEGSLSVEPSHGERCHCEQNGVGEEVENDECIVGGGSSITTKDDHFFVSVVKQLSVEKEKRGWIMKYRER